MNAFIWDVEGSHEFFKWNIAHFDPLVLQQINDAVIAELSIVVIMLCDQIHMPGTCRKCFQFQLVSFALAKYLCTFQHRCVCRTILVYLPAQKTQQAYLSLIPISNILSSVEHTCASWVSYEKKCLHFTYLERRRREVLFQNLPVDVY